MRSLSPSSTTDEVHEQDWGAGAGAQEGPTNDNVFVDISEWDNPTSPSNETPLVNISEWGDPVTSWNSDVGAPNATSSEQPPHHSRDKTDFQERKRLEREEEARTKTLDQYLADEAEKKIKFFLPELRRPNEGQEDENQYSGAVRIPKKGEKEEDFFSGIQVRYQSFPAVKEGKRGSKTNKQIFVFFALDRNLARRENTNQARSS